MLPLSENCSEIKISQQAADQLPWFHPIGIAEYELVRSLPSPLDRSLPSIEEIEAELSRSLEGEL
jgi:hypothetical protein